MESRCKAGVRMASTRGGGGVGFPWNGVQLLQLGSQGLVVVALLFVTATTLVIKEVHCTVTTDAVAAAPAPSTQQTQANLTFNQYEADALNAVFRKWSEQNPQLSTLLNWTLDQHPCNYLIGASEEAPNNSFQRAWNGVGCTSVLQNPSEFPNRYHVSVTSLRILGSNLSCQNGYTGYNQCGFDGIIGQLPSEISNLTNLQYLEISHNPSLTGPVPVELFRMPNLTSLDLNTNSLSGTLPSDVDNADCQLQELYLGNNNFSGNLRVSSQGTLFCSSLQYLDLSTNSLSGTLPSDFDNPDCQLETLYLSYNNFSGSLPEGILFCSSLRDLSLNYNSLSGTLPSDIYNADCKLEILSLSHNNFSGSLPLSSNGTLFCSSLQDLYVDFNQLDGPIDFQNWNGNAFQYLDFSNNHFKGAFSIGPYFDAESLDLSCNYFTSISFAKHNGSSYLNGSHIVHLSYLNISNNNFSGPFLEELLQMPSLSTLDLSKNNFWGSIDFGSPNVTTSLNVTTMRNYLNISNNNFNGTFFMGAYLNPSIMDLSNNQLKNIIFYKYNKTNSINLPLLEEIYFQNNNFRGLFPDEILTTPNLQILIASQNEYQTLQLPVLPLENVTKLSQVFLTNNKLDVVRYPNTGRFSFYNLQVSNVLFFGGNPICNKIKNTILSNICRFNQTEELRLVIPKSNTKMKVLIATSTSSIVVLVLLVSSIYVWRLMGRIKALHIILEGKLALASLKTIFLTEASSVKKIPNANIKR